MPVSTETGAGQLGLQGQESRVRIPFRPFSSTWEILRAILAIPRPLRNPAVRMVITFRLTRELKDVMCALVPGTLGATEKEVARGT